MIYFTNVKELSSYILKLKKSTPLLLSPCMHATNTAASSMEMIRHSCLTLILRLVVAVKLLFASTCELYQSLSYDTTSLHRYLLLEPEERSDVTMLVVIKGY
jgi:hypothetical protein